MQDVRYLLYSNGLGYAWEDPASLRPKQLRNCLHNRLDDKYKQNLQVKWEFPPDLSFLLHWNRITSPAVDSWMRYRPLMPVYYYIRLRLDMHHFNTCHAGTNKTDPVGETCPCSTDTQTVEHLLLRCRSFSSLRHEFEKKNLGDDSGI